MPGPCDLCSASCCKDYLITVTSFDVLRIARETGMSPAEFAMLSPLRLLSFDNDVVLECRRNGLMDERILALKSHPCVFLRSNRCKIHEIAPFVCRLYPYHASGGIIRRARCPIISNIGFRISGPGIKARDYTEQLERYKKIVEKWNKKQAKAGADGKNGGTEKCFEFILRESERKERNKGK